MNHCYRLIRSRKHNQLVAVPETAKGHGKAHGKTARSTQPTAIFAALQGMPSIALLSLFALLSPLFVQLSFAQGIAPTLPTGGQVVAGQVAMVQVGHQMTLQQQSNKAIINWQSFDIGKQATVTFQQPSSSAIALNRVLAGGGGISQIDGSLNADRKSVV